MINITDSTVFNTGADCIVNTINCVGFMGKGIALEFALRYPKLEEEYIAACHKKMVHTGRVYFYEIDGQKIINFPTKFHFKYPSQIEWIEQGLKHFVENYKAWGIESVAFPILGATNGGLNPKEVEQLMIKYLSVLDITVYICHSRLLEGKELTMVNAFKNLEVEDLKKYMRLTTKQVVSLKGVQQTIKRFTDILNAEAIGIDTYKLIFELLFNDEFHGDGQIKLF